MVTGWVLIKFTQYLLNSVHLLQNKHYDWLRQLYGMLFSLALVFSERNDRFFAQKSHRRVQKKTCIVGREKEKKLSVEVAKTVVALSK